MKDLLSSMETIKGERIMKCKSQINSFAYDLDQLFQQGFYLLIYILRKTFYHVGQDLKDIFLNIKYCTFQDKYICS